MRRMSCSLRGNHQKILLNFESMVKLLVIFYLLKIDDQARSKQARRYQAGTKAW
jgi:hypothetical protein